MEQNKLELYKDLIDSFNGPVLMAYNFGWNVSTVYKWLSGQDMGITQAICIAAERPEYSVKDLANKEIACDPIYLKIIAYFGSQSNTAQALEISQPSVNGWLFKKSEISLEKAERLEEVTRGHFHPSDFPHLASA